MLSLHQIDKHFLAMRFDQLLSCVVKNGFEVPAWLQVRLSQSPASSVALALRRVMDLTYGPTNLSREMLRFLLTQQLEDGSINHDPLATAVVIAGWRSWQREIVRSDSEQGATGVAAVSLAIERALAFLASTQDEDGLFDFADDRSTEDRAMVTSTILWLLSEDEAFRATVRWGDLLNWFEEHEEQLDDATHQLLALARVNTSKPAPRYAMAA